MKNIDSMKIFFTVNSIGKAITLIFVATSILLFTIITVLRTIKTTEDLKQRKVQLLESKQNELKSYIDIAYKIIENSYEKSKSEDEIKLRAGDKLEQVTAVLLSTMKSYYNQNKNKLNDDVLKHNLIQIVKQYKGPHNEYFWITDNTLPYPVMIMHPNSPQLDGKILNNKKFNCAMGKEQNLFQAMVEVCNAQGAGYVNYIWDKPTDKGIIPDQPKLSYVKMFKPYNWVIGTGVYIDDIENSIKNECLDIIGKMRYDNGTGYFWINDTKLPYPTMIMHATVPALNGKVLDNPKYNCAMGKEQNLFQAMVEVCNKSGEGFVDYIWDKPLKDGVKKDQPKLSFVKKFNKWGWVIGTGVYLDDINDEVAMLKYTSYQNLAMQLIVLFIAYVILYLVLQFYIKNIILKPVYRIQEKINLLRKGIFPKKIKIKSNTEIGDIIESTNILIGTLTNIKDFAVKVGQGKLDVKFDLLSEKDELGSSLIDMQKNLIIAKQEEDKRKQEETEQNWITQGLAKFADILRRNNDDLKKLSYTIISNLVNYLNANQGGVFLLNDTDDELDTDYENRYFILTAAYAYNRRKMLEKKIMWGEGQIGRCGYEKQTIFMTDVPSGYIEITSGMGSENPRCLLIVPLIFNNEIFGVIEIASFNVFEKYQIEFVEKVSENIASTISSVQVNNRTKRLLEQSRQQAEDLQAQEEEMRQNLEEIQATKEEMERAKQIADVAMNNLNSVKTPIISIDKNFNITYINKAGEEFSGYSKADALSKKCYDLWKNPHCNTNECRCFVAMQTRKTETAKTVIEKTGEDIIYTGTSIIDEDGIVTGAIEEIILISDIDKYC
jgi:methyl-accepting chemotaxis protein